MKRLAQKVRLFKPAVFLIGLVFSPVHLAIANSPDEEQRDDHGGLGITLNLNQIINHLDKDTEKKQAKSKTAETKPAPKKEEAQVPPSNSCLIKLTFKNDDDHPVTYQVFDVPETKETAPTLLAQSPGPVPTGGEVTLTPLAPRSEFGKKVRLVVIGTVSEKQVTSGNVEDGKIVTKETGLNVIEVETKVCGNPPLISGTGANAPPVPGVATPSTSIAPQHEQDREKEEPSGRIYDHEGPLPMQWLLYGLPLLILITLILLLMRLLAPPNYLDRVLRNSPPDEEVPDESTDNSYDDSSYDDSNYDPPGTQERPKIPPILLIPFLLRTGENPCDELIRLCEEARARAKAAADAAKAARDAANQARVDCEKARAATQAAQQELDNLLNSKVDEGSSWIEDDQGHRITSHDLDLENQAAAEARARHAAGDISTQELQDELSKWGPEQGPAAMAARRAKEAQARAQKIEAAKAKLEAAKKAQDEICGKVQPAEDKANELEKGANEAQQKADEICDEAKDCVKKRDEPKPPVTPDPAPPPPSTPGDPPPGTTPGGGTIPPHTPPPVGTPVTPPPRQRNSCCGKQFDQVYVDCLNRVVQRLRWLFPAEIGLGIFGRIKSGLVFLSLNGWKIDFFGDWDCPENNDMKCHDTVTIGGKCHPYHILSDFLYGYIAGYFGLGETGTSMGGIAFKLAQYYLGVAKHPLQTRDNTEPLPPPHWTEAQPAYRAGARLGARQYGFFTTPVTVEDLKVDPEGTPLADIAVIASDSCHPCHEVATPQDVTKDFSRVSWSFPLSPLNPGLDEQPGPGSNPDK